MRLRVSQDQVEGIVVLREGLVGGHLLHHLTHQSCGSNLERRRKDKGEMEEEKELKALLSTHLYSYLSSTHRGPIAVPLLVANVDSDQETHVGGHA